MAKWRILDLKGLREEIDYPSHPSVFEKTIRRLEKAHIIKSFKDPWTNRKFIYLSDVGEKLVNDTGSPLAVSEETMLHDAKVAQFTRLLMERLTFTDVKLEHEIGERNSSWLPDAMLWGEKGGVKFTMAFELELTRKSKNRIREKIKKYLSSNYYDYAFYLFCSENVMKSYQQFITTEFGEDAFKKLLLFWNPSLMSRKMNINSGRGYFKSKEVNFNDIF